MSGKKESYPTSSPRTSPTVGDNCGTGPSLGCVGPTIFTSNGSNGSNGSNESNRSYRSNLHDGWRNSF